MRYLVSFEDQRFFRYSHHIEFSDFLSTSQVDELTAIIESGYDKPIDQTPLDLYINGYDQFRQNKKLKRFVTNPKLAEIAAQLSNEKTLRLAFTQTLAANQLLSPLPLSNSADLQSLSSVNPLSIGLIIRLKGSSTTEKELLTASEEERLLLPEPQTAGSLLYFPPDIPLDLNSLLVEKESLFLLIAYAPHKIQYRHNPTNPHAHTLKRLGYVFGDLLNETTHPVVYR